MHELLHLNQHKDKDEKAGPHLHLSPSFFEISFINFWSCWAFIAALAFSSYGERRLLSSGSPRASFAVEHPLPGSKAQDH